MASPLFQGTAQPTPTNSYVTSSTDYPKWLQDAIYNQINTATMIANTPYQEYSFPTVADLSEDQLTAYADIRANQRSWQPAMDYASAGMAKLSTQPGQLSYASPYYQAAGGMSGIEAAQPSLQQQASMLGGINYQAASGDLYSQQNAYLNPDLANYYLQGGANTLGAVGNMDIGAQASPFFQQQANVLSALNYNNPASNLATGQNQYLNPNLANQYLQGGNTAYGVVGQMDIAGAANPYLSAQMSALSGLNYNAPLAVLAASQNQYISPDVANQMMQRGQTALTSAAGVDIGAAANPFIQQQIDALKNINFNAPTSDLYAAQNQYISPTLANQALQTAQQAYGKSGAMDIASAANPFLQNQANYLSTINYNAPVSALSAQQNQYLNPEIANALLQNAQRGYSAAGAMDIAAAANPYLQNQANTLNALNYNAATQNLAAEQNKYLSPTLANDMLQQGQSAYKAAGSIDIPGSANEFLRQAAQTSAEGVQQYMNPYQEGVMNAIAQQGARNLSENLLPAVSDAFIRAGQFGGSRMGEFGERALRDTQEAILNQQSQVLQQGYGQALSASQADLARQAQLASTAGQLTGQQAQSLANIGQAQTAAGQAQQQAGLSAAQNVAQSQQQALSQAQQAAAQQGQMAGLAGQLTGQQQSALTALAQAQAQAAQAQQQAGLSAAQNVGAAQQQAIAQVLQGAGQQGQMAGLAGQLTGQQQAALLNLGQAQAQFGQAQQQAGLGAAQNVSAAQQQAINQAIQRASQYGQTAQLAGQLTGQQQSALANIGQIQAQAAQAQQQAGLGAAQNLTAAQQQALTQAQQGASQYGQAAQLAGQLTGQQAQSLLNLGQAQTSAGQTQQQYGLSALQNLANIQQQALGQAQQTAAQYGQMGQAAGQLYGQQAANMLDLAKTQLGAGQAQQQTGIGAAQYLANLRQQDVSQALQGAAQYGSLGGALAGMTQEQQKILAGLGQSAGTAAGADLNTQMAALNNIAALATQYQGMQAKDAAALENIGQTQQQNVQQNLTAAYNQWMQQQLYQQQMADWMNTQIRGMAPITPSQTATSTQGNTYTYGPSPLSQILGAYAAYRGFTGG